MEDFEAKAGHIESEVMQYHRQRDGWTAMKPQKGMGIWYRRSPHFPGTLYKFECLIEAPDDDVYMVMKPPLTTDERLSWDKSIKHFECMKNISEEMMVGLIITHSAMAGMIASREFLDLYVFRRHLPSEDLQYDRVSWIFAGNVDLPEVRPQTKQYVRARNFPTGYAICKMRNDPRTTKLILYVNVDIGGMIPQSLIDVALPKQQISYIESVKKRVFATGGRK